MLHPIRRERLNFVVVGTGRCGTVYFAKLLTSGGVACGHERIFGPDGIGRAVEILKSGGTDSAVARNSGLTVGKNVLADASYMAVPYLDHTCLKSALVIHAVRNPVDVILSFHNKLQYFHAKPNQWESFILSHMPRIKNESSPLDRACCYVVNWNRWIEEQCRDRPYIRVGVNDGEKLAKCLKFKFEDLGVANSHETWKEKKLPLARPATRDDVLQSAWGDRVKSLARDYGYEG